MSSVSLKIKDYILLLFNIYAWELTKAIWDHCILSYHEDTIYLLKESLLWTQSLSLLCKLDNWTLLAVPLQKKTVWTEFGVMKI